MISIKTVHDILCIWTFYPFDDKNAKYFAQRAQTFKTSTYLKLLWFILFEYIHNLCYMQLPNSCSDDMSWWKNKLLKDKGHVLWLLTHCFIKNTCILFSFFKCTIFSLIQVIYLFVIKLTYHKRYFHHKKRKVS